MGRILSGRLRSSYVADPGSAGPTGRFQRVRIMRDVEHAVDDIETILRMSPDDRLKEHVRRQVARLAGGAMAGGEGVGGEGGARAGGEGMGGDAGSGGGGGEGGAGEEGPGDDLEAELWN